MIITANGAEISVLLSSEQQNDYISLTDIAKYKNPDDPRIVISNWLSSYSTIDFLAAWETLYNPNFNRMEFHTVRNETGRLVLTSKQWIERMNAIGITSHAGRYSGNNTSVANTPGSFFRFTNPSYCCVILSIRFRPSPCSPCFCEINS